MNRYVLPALAAVFLCSCGTSTITVELPASSEGNPAIVKKTIPEDDTTAEVEIPARHSISVPFMVQAPNGNWDDPYQEACEEASVIMLDYFLRNASLTPDQANREILQLVEWEEANNYKEDVNLDQLAAIVESYYGYNTRIIEEPTVGAIMHEISQGNPVVVPAAGRQLGNPYFSGEGPWYHMLLIRGYDRRNFITNDPGTKRGEEYEYSHDVLMNAIHDWTGVKEDIGNGKKRVLVIAE